MAEVLRVVALDVRTSHKDNPDCEMRIAQNPQGQWYCVDCGVYIMNKGIECGTDNDELLSTHDVDPLVCIQNCYIKPKPGDSFGVPFKLDGYAVIPLEDHKPAVEEMRESKERADGKPKE